MKSPTSDVVQQSGITESTELKANESESVPDQILCYHPPIGAFVDPGPPVSANGPQLSGSNHKQKIKRTREDIKRERQALLLKTECEVDRIVAECHAKLPKEEAQSKGAIYARYSSDVQDSVADQVRTVCEAAVERGIFVPREYVYFDLGVSGGKNRRPGLDSLRDAIQQNEFQVLLVFSTNRLFRRAYRAMQFLDEELAERGIRGIFVKQNLDTADGNQWQTAFQLFAAVDESQILYSGDHVRAGHEGLFNRGMVCGSLPLGYTGEEVPGESTKKQKPRLRIVVDPLTAPWILKIFHWYVEEGKSLSKIAQDLNEDPHAPVPPKSQTGIWTQRLVRQHLQRASYRGLWSYGANETVWSTAKDYARPRPREEPLQQEHREHLRIVSDEIWDRAQNLLDSEKSNSGRKPKEESRQQRPQLLRGLLRCPEHGRTLALTGAGGGVYACPVCRSIAPENRPLFTHLRRDLALQMTCENMADLIRADDELVELVVTACQQEVKQLQLPDPVAITHLRAKEKRLSTSIDFNRRNPGDTDEEQRRTAKLVKQIERERRDVQAEILRVSSAKDNPIVVPTAKQVRAMLDGLAHTLMEGVSSESEAAIRLARRIIDDLTGGRIELFQMGERKKCKGWLQGRFRVDVVSLAASKLLGIRCCEGSNHMIEVRIDFKPPDIKDLQADQAKQLYDQDLMNQEIAKEMGCLPSRVTLLLKHWFESRGLEKPNSHARLGELRKQREDGPLYIQYADQVQQLANEGLSEQKIAVQLKTSTRTVASAYKYWYESRELPVPSPAERRQKRLQRGKELYDQGKEMKAIAAELGYSTRGFKIALGKYLADRGLKMIDGRTRRFRDSAD